MDELENKCERMDELESKYERLASAVFGQALSPSSSSDQYIEQFNRITLLAICWIIWKNKCDVIYGDSQKFSLFKMKKLSSKEFEFEEFIVQESQEQVEVREEFYLLGMI